MRFEVEFRGNLIVRDDEGSRLPSAEELESIIGSVADELAKMDAQDASLATDANDAGVEITVSVDALDPVSIQ